MPGVHEILIIVVVLLSDYKYMDTYNFKKIYIYKHESRS